MNTLTFDNIKFNSSLEMSEFFNFLKHTKKEDFKLVKNDKYIILFNKKTGHEILTGINGYSDPIVLEHPSLIDVGIMGTCLNNCDICYQGGKDNNRPNMTLNNFKMIVDQTKDYCLQFALGGRGDPDKHKYFKEILKYCRDNDIVPNYTTSGINLSDESILITKDYVGAVAVSDYGKDFTYSAINKFIAHDIKTNIHFVLTSSSIDYASKLISDFNNSYLNKLIDINKLNAIVFLLFKPQGKGKGKSYLLPSKEQIINFTNILRSSNTPFKIGLDSCCMCKISEYVGLTEKEILYGNTCEGSLSSSYITSDMKYIPCSFDDHTRGEEITKENTIYKIWNNSSIFEEFRNMLKNNPNKCPLFS